MRTTSNQSQLTASDILDIRQLHDGAGVNDAELARQFGVSRKAIYNIVNRKTWASVPTPTTLREYPGYTVYPDGRVLSNSRGSFVSPIQRTTGPAVRLRNRTGSRRTVSVNALVSRGFRA